MDNGFQMTPPSSGISLTWLLRLRWISVASQTGAILVGKRVLGDELGVGPLLVLVALGALSNLALARRLKAPDPVHPSLPGFILGLDILLLTGLLYFSGGAANPFTAIYLVHVALAAVVMRGAWAWALGGLAILGFGLLFFWNVHVHSLAHMNHGGGDGISLHLVGMWVAFAIAAGLIAAFVGRVNEALRQREAEVAALRDLNARQARLAALTTLAAGVAHELGTPLGTIAVAAGELQRSAGALGLGDGDILQDATLIRQEVDRCRRILDQMAEPSGASLGEDFQDLAWADLEADLVAGLPAEDRARVAFQWPLEACGPVPRRGLARALRALLSNALQAAPFPAQVLVRASLDATRCHLVVEDAGCGMAPEVLARAGEPFFTTRAEGRGMGLGLFLARTFAEQLGGGLQVDSAPGRGTRVALDWPRDLHA